MVQRVRRASVTVAGRTVGEIGPGLLLLVGAEAEDEPADAAWMAKKCVNLRIFADEDGKMNRSVADVGGRILAVSQFTLLGDCRKGNRPSFGRAMEPVTARKFFDDFVKLLEDAGAGPVETGEFGAMMDVELINDGPVTFLLDSRKKF